MNTLILSQLKTKIMARECVFLGTRRTTIPFFLSNPNSVNDGIVACAYFDENKSKNHMWKENRAVGLCSAVVVFNIPIGNIAAFDMICASAAATVLQELTGAIVKIKWPSDIIIGGRKTGEIRSDYRVTEITSVIASEIKLYLTDASRYLSKDSLKVSESIFKQSGHKLSFAEVLEAYYNKLETMYFDFMRNENCMTKQQQHLYNSLLLNIGRQVFVDAQDDNGQKSNAHVSVGIAKGIDEIGRLICRTNEGQETRLENINTHIRGLY